MLQLAVYFGLCVLVFIKTLSEGKSLPFCSSLSYDRLVWNVLRYSVIREHFSCTRVALINWKSTSFSYLAALLLLCGDVSQNPGPDVFRCGVCALEVADDDAAVCCDYCDHWIHVTYDPCLSMNVYNDMVSNPPTEPWFCYSCKESFSGCSINNLCGGINCVCLNARSVVPKRFELSAYILANKFDVVAITETFLDNSVHDIHITPPGYTVFRKDRSRHDGGVFLFLRKALNGSLRPDLDNDCKILWVSIPTKSSSLLFGIFYRWSSAPLSTLEALRSSVCSAVSPNQSIVLCGDFNLPDIDWSTTSPSVRTPATTMFCDIVSDCFLTQLVSTSTCRDNILDLVLTNVPSNVFSVAVCDNLPGTDHDAVNFVIEAEVNAKNIPPRYLYDYSKIDQEHFATIFSRVPWDLIDYDSDIEVSWAMWKDLFLSAIDESVPKLKWNRRKIKHWFSQDTISLIHKK